METFDPFFILFIFLSNEQNSAEILPYGFDIVFYFKELITYQKKLIFLKSKNFFSNGLLFMLKNLELERIGFLLKAYHRLRIWKIEKFFIRSNKKNYLKFLSKSEKKYAQIYEFFFLKKLGEIICEIFNLKIQRNLRLKNLFLSQKKILKTDYFVFFKVLKKKKFFESNILSISDPKNFYGNEIYCMKYNKIKNLVLFQIIYLL
ncbi:hypothetical protein HAN_1g33 (nucleomorph) [Hemiselmis andersenii]|uniref:DNA replication complex GINS protein SLD5 n=1 Tax=Hemiselmis andersenii TaxID=464988 RepID=A9BK46_HEMAN|nr:hypothetical protein HAN_1g33 [Hemiselmis andersenii]ABW97879.1 hypothetical protein HAN_1g33 [Hemiselmis andersenii]